MKVPEKTETSQNNDISKVKEYRSKRKMKKLVKFLIVLAVILIIGIIIIVNREVISESLRGIFSKVNTTTGQNEGFPVDLPESSEHSLHPFDDGFTLLTDTYLYSYNMAGRQHFAVQHGYINPVCTTNSKRVLIYDKGGHKFAFYSKTSEIYQQIIDNEIIVSAFVSDAEYVAVVTSGGQYSNVVYLYDRNGQLKYKHYYLDEKIMQVAFSPDERFIYMTLAKSDSGNIITEVVKYSMDNEELWSSELIDSISVSLTATAEYITVVCDNAVFSFDAENGAENGSYEYPGPIEDYSISPDMNVFLFDNYSDNQHTVVVLDKKCTATASAKAGDTSKEIFGDNETVYLLTSDGISSFDASLEKLKDYNYDDEFISFEIIGSDVLLMSGNTIDCKRI